MPTAHGKQDELPDGNDILLTFQGINRGRAVNETSRKLGELVSAVKQYGKKGTLTITFRVAPGKQDGTLEVSSTTVATPPVEEHPAIFFITDDDLLTRDDPTMEPMFGRSDVEDGAQH